MKYAHLTTFIAILTILAVPALASAQGFVSLSNIPGVTQTGIGFSDFLNGAFKFGLAIAATLAVVMITIGGVEYMGRDSYASKEAGKERITNAIIGLIIALLIWVILFTINPNLLNFNININKAGQSGNVPNSTSATSGSADDFGEDESTQQTESERAAIERERIQRELRNNPPLPGEDAQIQQQSVKESPFGSIFQSSADKFKNFWFHIFIIPGIPAKAGGLKDLSQKIPFPGIYYKLN